MSMFDSTVRKNGHVSCSSRSCASRASSSPTHSASAVPVPYQPGSMIRGLAHENTHGMARRSSMRAEAVRDDGRLPMFSSAISVIGVAARNQSTKPGVS